MTAADRKKLAKAARDSLAAVQGNLRDARTEPASLVTSEEAFGYLCSAVATLADVVAQLVNAVESAL